MTTDNSKDLATVLGRMRDESPALRDALEHNKPRRELADSLVQMRIGAGLTQKNLAQKMQRDQAFISRLESSVGPVPDTDTIARYADACGYAGGYLFVEREPEGRGGADEQMQVVNLNDNAQDESVLVHALCERRHTTAAGQ